MTSDNQEQEPEKKKVGVYICHCGGNISDHVDVDQLTDRMKHIEGVAVTRTNMFMCSDPGQALIRDDIQNGAINRVVVASCAPSLHETTFRNAIKQAQMNPYLYEHANIREQVSWVHHGDKATDKATALVAAAVAKAGELEPLTPVQVTATHHATVIGGGVAGMRAALDLADTGSQVTLVEKTPFLGGRVAKLNRLYPTGLAAEQIVRTLAEEVCAHADIEVLTCSEEVGQEGFVGNFSLTLRTIPPSEEETSPEKAGGDNGYVPFSGYRPPGLVHASSAFTRQTGAVIMATGFRPYRPFLVEYGYLSLPEVMTLPEFLEETARHPSKGETLMVNGRAVRRMAFIHCVGSRQIPGIHEPAADGSMNEYCSRTCCSAVLQAAVEIREAFPQTQVLDYYRDIRTYGRYQEAYYEKASENRVLFLRFEPDAPPQVERSSGGRYPLRVRVRDTLTFGEELSADVDLVVLAVGMVAQPIPSLVEMMKLPTGLDRFLQEVHPKLRPVEVATHGIMLAGTCQAPMDTGEASAAAQAAAAKVAALLGKGIVELDPYVAEIAPELCQGHGSCATVCPVEGALTLADGKTRINAALCTGCGICVAQCPESAINIKGWSLTQYERMVDAIATA